jgi:hypothetical protein
MRRDRVDPLCIRIYNDKPCGASSLLARAALSPARLRWSNCWSWSHHRRPHCAVAARTGRRARRAATQVACASNLRQWALAAHLYANANHDYLPRRGYGPPAAGQRGRCAESIRLVQRAPADDPADPVRRASDPIARVPPWRPREHVAVPRCNRCRSHAQFLRVWHEHGAVGVVGGVSGQDHPRGSAKHDGVHDRWSRAELFRVAAADASKTVQPSAPT